MNLLKKTDKLECKPASILIDFDHKLRSKCGHGDAPKISREIDILIIYQTRYCICS